MKDTSNYFVTPVYDTVKDLDAKIKSVCDFHLASPDWSLDGEPEIKKVSGGYQAVIPLVYNKNKSDDNRFGSR